MAILAAGTQLSSTYEVERFLGEGAFAEVYRVRHRFLGRQALKLFKHTGMTVSDIEDSLDEAILLSRIGHPNIVRVFDANIASIEDTMYGFFTMEHVPGGSLDQFLEFDKHKTPDVSTAVELIRQACRGLDVAHSADPPIVHRDIKPQNILVGYEADGLRARISDFGLAKRVNPLTLMATAAGTLAFKPPEVFADLKADSPAADIWALGVTMYALLTFTLPYRVDPVLGWGQQNSIFSKEPKTPHALNRRVPKLLSDITMTCMSIDLNKRFSSANQLLHELDTAVSQWSEETQLAPSSAGEENAPNDGPQELSQSAKEAISEANQIALKTGNLQEAADRLEEAFSQFPELRTSYENRVTLWRRGISM